MLSLVLDDDQGLPQHLVGCFLAPHVLRLGVREASPLLVTSFLVLCIPYPCILRKTVLPKEPYSSQMTGFDQRNEK